ncbi:MULTISPECIES: FG-GAP repeat protein [Halobacteriales]|uniref:FG-GAP repeat protein n=1 Tax=Halobacteriales TaxID=2235 RepID=UPI000FE34DB2
MVSSQRRRLLAIVAGVGTVGMAGCGALESDDTDVEEDSPANEDDRNEDGDENNGDGSDAIQFSSFEQVSKLTDENGRQNNEFGCSTSIAADGTTAIVGTVIGSPVVFEEKDGNWQQITDLTPDGGNTYDRYGGGVSIASNGAVALVGARDDGNGAAYIFEETGGSWQQGARITAESETSEGLEFPVGYSVSLASDGSAALIGARIDENGAAYVFEETGGNWQQVAKLTANDGDQGDAFGYSVSLASDGSAALIGAARDEDPNGEQAGSAYVFKDTGGQWQQVAKLTANDGDQGDGFGFSASLASDGSAALIGAVADEDPNGRFAGSAYVFK